MASLNKVMIIGNLGRDPETRYTPNGDAVSTLAVATSESWKDRNTGEKQEKTEWHRCVVWGKLAEVCRDYLRKGSQVYLEGRLETRKWQDKDGVDRYTTEIRVDAMKMLGSRGDQGDRGGQGNDGGRAQGQPTRAQEAQPQQQRAQQQQQQPAYASGGGGYGGFDGDDDIPFAGLGRGMAAYCI